jgi:hypothetical protein
LLIFNENFALQRREATTLVHRGQSEEGAEEGEVFSCGGGPISNFAASFVSVPCDRSRSEFNLKIKNLKINKK